MTPSPTPTPDAVLTRFRLIRYGVEGDEVAIPVDKYGRVMVTPPDDGNVRYCPWWADTFSIFDDASDTELVNAMSDFGFVECLTIEDVHHSFTVNLDNIEETLEWNEAKRDFQLNVPMWQNAQANLQYRVFVEDSSTIYAVIDMETGRLATYTDDQNNDRFLRYVPDSGGSGIDEIWPELLSQHSDLATQAGGVKQIEFFVSDEGDNNETQTIANTVDGEVFVVNVNMDGQYRPGSAELPLKVIVPYWRLVDENNGYTVVDNDGKIIVDNQGYGVRLKGSIGPLNGDLTAAAIQEWGESSAVIMNTPSGVLNYGGVVYQLYYERSQAVPNLDFWP